jgi:hypothetical protein
VLSNADTATRSADLAAGRLPWSPGKAAPPKSSGAARTPSPEIRLGRGYGNTNVGAWLYTQLLPDVAEYVNTGAVPMIQAGDLADLPGLVEFGAALVETPGAQFRSFALWNSVELGELLREELKLLGLYPALDASGRITFRRVRIPRRH